MMSNIRLVPEQKILSPTASIPPLLFNLDRNFYAIRATRLRHLAINNPLSNYLLFVAHVADAQHAVIQEYRIDCDLRTILARNKKSILASEEKLPLAAHSFPRDKQWQTLLHTLIKELQAKAPEQVVPILQELKQCDSATLEHYAQTLLEQNFEQINSGVSLFIWAALSLYWRQLASQLALLNWVDFGGHNGNCPVCGSIPVASVIKTGNTQGLRYLHCSLCEVEWHVVRSKCSNCDSSQKLSYYSLDQIHTATKAENCDLCNSYLKIVYLDQDSHIEVVADDLAALNLDSKLEEQNSFHSGLNPYLFPGKVNVM